MKKSRIASIIRKLNIPLRNNKGFTLIEAIATIAIVGIVVGPIAIVFQGALVESMVSKEQLKANQIGQQYVEVIESMEYEDLKTIVDTNAGALDAATITAYNLPEVIDGMDVVVDVHYGVTRTDGTTDLEYNTAFDTDDFEMDTMPVTTITAYDMLTHMYTSRGNGMDFYDPTHVFRVDLPLRTFTNELNDRDLEVTYEYVDATKTSVRVTAQRTGSSATYTKEPTLIENAFVIYCDDTTSTTGYLPTQIVVNNYTDEKIRIYVYETLEDTILPNVVANMGLVEIIRGMDEVDNSVNTHRIYEVEVTVFRDGETTNPLTHVVTTVLGK